MGLAVWLVVTRVVKTGYRQADIEADRGKKLSIVIDVNMASIGDEGRWKLIRIEAFKCPDQRNLLCAAVGSGVQLILVILLIFLLGAMGMYYSYRGSLHTAGVLLYAFTACNPSNDIDSVYL